MITIDKDTNGNISIMEIPPPLASIMALCLELYHGSIPKRYRDESMHIIRRIKRLNDINFTNNLNQNNHEKHI